MAAMMPGARAETSWVRNAEITAGADIASMAVEPPAVASVTGIGAVQVRQPRLRDRGAGGERLKFTPAILPPYARRSKSLEVLLPILYLNGLSTGDFAEALAALLGQDAPGLSAYTIPSLKAT